MKEYLFRIIFVNYVDIIGYEIGLAITCTNMLKCGVDTF